MGEYVSQRGKRNDFKSTDEETGGSPADVVRGRFWSGGEALHGGRQVGSSAWTAQDEWEAVHGLHRSAGLD